MSTTIKARLTGRKHVKAFALAAASKQAHRFTRIGGEFFLRCGANLKEFIRIQVAALPSKGKTIR